MRKTTGVIALIALSGCAMTDEINMITSFSPYVTKEGQQAFRYVASATLPSYYGSADVQKTHETWIGTELGQRQYCLNGWEIVSTTPAPEGRLIYEGICKQR